jgi:hypothetical protein
VCVCEQKHGMFGVRSTPFGLGNMSFLTFSMSLGGLSKWYLKYSTTFFRTLDLTLRSGISSASLSPSAMV